MPPLPSIEAEQCYLWWEILLVTDRDEAAIREVFVFVEDECELLIRLPQNQDATVALLGAVPADAFELFVLECEEHLQGIERDALALEKDRSSKNNLDGLFRLVHSIKGNAGLLLGQVHGAPLAPTHLLQLLHDVAHGLESHLDPFRGVDSAPLSEKPSKPHWKRATRSEPCCAALRITMAKDFLLPSCSSVWASVPKAHLQSAIRMGAKPHFSIPRRNASR